MVNWLSILKCNFFPKFWVHLIVFGRLCIPLPSPDPFTSLSTLLVSKQSNGIIASCYKPNDWENFVSLVCLSADHFVVQISISSLLGRWLRLISGQSQIFSLATYKNLCSQVSASVEWTDDIWSSMTLVLLQFMKFLYSLLAS